MSERERLVMGILGAGVELRINVALMLVAIEAGLVSNARSLAREAARSGREYLELSERWMRMVRGQR